jgi:hypothetical protein
MKYVCLIVRVAGLKNVVFGISGHKGVGQIKNAICRVKLPLI